MIPAEISPFLSPARRFSEAANYPIASSSTDDYPNGPELPVMSLGLNRSPYLPYYSQNSFQHESPLETRRMSAFGMGASPLLGRVRELSLDERPVPRPNTISSVPEATRTTRVVQASDANFDQLRYLESKVKTETGEADDDDTPNRGRNEVLEQRVEQEVAEESESDSAQESQSESELQETGEETMAGRRKRPEISDTEEEGKVLPEGERPFGCKYCEKRFKKAQALGGHMSRRHPGKSRQYSDKMKVRRHRGLERARLLLAKKRYFDNMGYDFDDMIKTLEGRMRAKSLLVRTQVKRLKREVTYEDASELLDAQLATGQE